MADFLPLHVEHTGEFRLPVPLDQAFPLFTPEGERAWVPGWNPVYLHPRSPASEAGTLFCTSHGGEETVWLVLRYEPFNGIAEYARVAPATRAGTVRVHCTAVAGGETMVRVTYELTALTPAGNAILAAFTAEGYQAMLAEWAAAIRSLEGFVRPH